MWIIYTEWELLEKSEIPTDKQDNGSRILSDVAAHIRNILEKGA